MHGARVIAVRAATLLTIALCSVPHPVPAQENASAAPPPAPSAPASREMPRPEQLEPAVDTSALSSAAAPTPAATNPAGGKTAAAAPSSAAATGVTPASARAAATKSAPGKRPDRLELDTTEITGNRELPKVLYIVPWKRSDLGDLVGRPANSLLDEVLEPLDRDVFQRQNRYYDALRPDAAGPRPAAVQGGADKP